MLEIDERGIILMFRLNFIRRACPVVCINDTRMKTLIPNQKPKRK